MEAVNSEAEIQWENVVNPQNVVFPQLCLDFSERAAQMY